MRGALALARAAKTWALSVGRNYVTPDDIRDLASPVLAHRLIVDPESEFAGVKAEDIISRILVDIAAPAYRAA
jgi:MoxR-like ATPase